ncbi:hypothetical protein DH86_00000060 [Scytalidium sp. 3C]|nr:hypothetical protein DH86_00000060 [Scytalidium sp. 3C]
MRLYRMAGDRADRFWTQSYHHHHHHHNRQTSEDLAGRMKSRKITVLWLIGMRSNHGMSIFIISKRESLPRSHQRDEEHEGGLGTTEAFRLFLVRLRLALLG